MLVAGAAAIDAGGSLLIDHGTTANHACRGVYVSDKSTFNTGRLQIQEGYNEQ